MFKIQNKEKIFKTITWILLVLALFMSVRTVYIFYEIFTDCIPSSSSGGMVTTDCGGERSYSPAVRSGQITISIWIIFFAYLIARFIIENCY